MLVNIDMYVNEVDVNVYARIPANAATRNASQRCQTGRSNMERREVSGGKTGAGHN